MQTLRLMLINEILILKAYNKKASKSYSNNILCFDTVKAYYSKCLTSVSNIILLQFNDS